MDSQDEKIFTIRDKILESDSPEEGHTALLAEIFRQFLALILVDASLQTKNPPCNTCPRHDSSNTDELATCVFSRALVKGISLICLGMVKNAEGYKSLVYPDIVARLEGFAAECIKMLEKCSEENRKMIQ